MIQKLQDKKPSALLQFYLDMVCKHLPVVDRTISQHGDLSLRKYLDHFCCAAGAPFQGRDDLADIIFDYVAPLLGTTAARDAAEDLAVGPIVLTSNHHGVEYYAQTLQSRLIFSLLNTPGASSARRTVPVFACGNVPLNNLTYPRGMLVYRGLSQAFDSLPHKLAIFPDRLKRAMVSAAPAVDETMVGNLQGRLERMIRQGIIPSDVAIAARTILDEDYRSTALAGIIDYSEQAVILNSLIWKRLFHKGFKFPVMIYLELERIVDALLLLDLCKPSSFAWCVIFDPLLRENVLAELNGIKGCWNLDMIDRRSAASGLDEVHPEAGRYCGTVFFWAVDGAGRRIPLRTISKPSGAVVFRGVDDEGTAMEIPLTPDAVAALLKKRQLIPSLFSCFLVLAFARGLCCVGGYFQGEYLPEMQRGLAGALQRTPGYGLLARSVAQVPTTLYLDGMVAVMSRLEDGSLVPAGPLEIVAGGGLTAEDIMSVQSLTVREAHLADLLETITDCIPPELRPAGLRKQLAAEGSPWLEGKVVVK